MIVRVFSCGLVSVQWDWSRFDFPRRVGQASSLSDSNLNLKRREGMLGGAKEQRNERVLPCVCVFEMKAGEDVMKVSWENFAKI